MARAFAIAGLCAACSKEAPQELREVPLYSGATFRDEETAFQRRLLEVLAEPGRPVTPTRIYGTEASFPSVVEFYEDVVRPDSVVVRRFAVASRMRELAEGIRAGGAQQRRVGRRQYEDRRGDRAGDDAASAGRGGALAPSAVADSLDGLAARLADVEGAIAFARVRLSEPPGAAALVTIERPHLNPARLTVDSLTVITIAGAHARK